jgi:hypothetical protein
VGGDGVDATRRALVVFAGLGRYCGGGMQVAPQARIDDGRLDVTLVSDMTGVQLLRELPRLFNGTVPESAFVDCWSTPSLRIDADGSFGCLNYSSGNGGGSSCNSDYEKALKLTARTAERVAGTFRLKTPDGTADVTFDLKVESVAVPAGTPLPPDGGEPGKAVLAHFAAIEKNDFKALMATAQPEQAKMMAASEKAGEAKEMFKMMREMSPRKVKVTGGTVDGDDALVDFEGVEGGKPVKGVAECVRIAGKWYMSGTSTRQ